MMNVRFFRYVGLLFALFLVLVLLQMCDKDSTITPINEEPINVTGGWQLTSTITSNTCGLQDGGTEVSFISPTTMVIYQLPLSVDTGGMVQLMA